ncbi:MAG TPA: hypothetical protein EYP35_02930 [Desulfobacterales bacterium]|nr:hypothetical protein [Desulfobacterales bacterium]
MPGQIKTFRIPCYAASLEETELNSFLRSVQILTVHRDFVADGSNSFQVFTVEYFDKGTVEGNRNRKKAKVDYREILPDEDFALFARLRQWRKETAASEGTAVYTIFTNEQLAQIAGKRPENKAGLQEIAGIGTAKIDKYADTVLALLAEINQQQRIA